MEVKTHLHIVQCLSKLGFAYVEVSGVLFYAFGTKSKSSELTYYIIGAFRPMTCTGVH